MSIASKAVSKLYRVQGNKDVAITLLGFAGAKEAHIQKYAQIYRDRGYDTVHFTSLLPIQYTMDLKNTREVGSVVDHLKEVLKHKEIAVHTFSMNGVFTLCSIELQHPELEFLKKTRGILFDSGPVDLGFREIIPSMLYANRYFKHILEGADAEMIRNYRRERKKQFLRLVEHYSTLPIRRALGQNVDAISAYDFLKNHLDLPPVLSFAYSKTDAICGPRTIKSFAEFHKSEGRLVDQLYLKDTPHVDHFRKYPKEYLRLVDSFLGNLQPRG